MIARHQEVFESHLASVLASPACTAKSPSHLEVGGRARQPPGRCLHLVPRAGHPGPGPSLGPGAKDGPLDPRGLAVLGEEVCQLPAGQDSSRRGGGAWRHASCDQGYIRRMLLMLVCSPACRLLPFLDRKSVALFVKHSKQLFSV